MKMIRRGLIVFVLAAGCSDANGDKRNAQPQPAPYPRTAGDLPRAPGPLSPKEELATFKIVEGFKVELVAAEPDIVDPVAMCFDERGRLFVCEMRGYPNGGIGTGNEARGKIKCLTDTNSDGTFETSVTFAEGLRFPMGITPYKGGVIVAVAPDLLYLEDTDGDSKSDRQTVLYSGFNLANIQQMVNSLQWGLDNWVYGCAGNDGGTVRSAEKPETPPVALRNRGFRFKPGVPASLEPTSGGGQYGLTADDYQRWFTATNSQHLRQIVLPEHYLRRNPYLPVSAVTIDIPEHGAAAKVFRISPFEPWRVERTTRRAGGPDAARFPTTELIPGGYITSACSPLIYTGELFPAEYSGNNFVCDPANNLIHRELLQENGAVFKAVRAYPDREFLASTDNWFRPVHLTTGPDGAIYVLDFYREVIETPLSLPDDIKKQLNLESRGRGRIWRIAPTGFKPTKLPDFTKLTATQLGDQLLSPNPWRRITAQRMLMERYSGAVDLAKKELAMHIAGLLPSAKGKPASVNILWTLSGIDGLLWPELEAALKDPTAGVRENALRLLAVHSKTIPAKYDVGTFTTDPSARVRFQLAFTAGGLPVERATDILANLLEHETDPWIVTAALSSAGGHALELLARLTKAQRKPRQAVVARVAAVIGTKGETEQIARVLTMVAEGNRAAGTDVAILDGLGQGMRNTTKPLPVWLANPPSGMEPVTRALHRRFAVAAEVLADEKNKLADRLAAAGLLAFGPFDLAGPALAGAIVPAWPADLQLAAVRALAVHTDPKVATFYLKEWKGYSPSTRAAVLDALLTRPDRILALLVAVEKKEVTATALSPAQIQQLKQHPNAKVKSKAAAVFTQAIDADRAKVVAAYATALELKGDAKSGKVLFQKYCSACHKLDGVGNDVGANLLATTGNKSSEDLLIAVFDPNREVDPRYLTYLVGTADERVLTGIVVAETPTSITLRRAEGSEDVILRANLSLFRATALSLMPVGLEKELKPQDVADLFAYLRVAGK